MEKKYHVDLTPKQRKDLRKMVRVGRNKAKAISRAHILLKSDEGKTDREIAELLYIDEETVKRTRQRFWDGGLELAINGQAYPLPEPMLTEKQEAYLVALACSDAPEGYSKWTIEMLRDRMVEDGQIETVSNEKIRLTLKKTTSSHGV